MERLIPKHKQSQCWVTQRPSTQRSKTTSIRIHAKHQRQSELTEDRNEVTWRQQLEAGSSNARRPKLQSRSIDGTTSTSQTFSSIDEDTGARYIIEDALSNQNRRQQNIATSNTDDKPSSSPITQAQAAWDALPARYKVIVATSMSFVICNMDKVNISVAIIPMAEDFGWSPTTAGLVQSAFFYGYMLSQLPGGYISSKLGGRLILPFGVGLWSAATAAVPIVAGTMPGLFLSRAAVGLGEGVAPSAAVDIVASTVDKSERARAISLVFGGLHVGSLLGLLIAPAIIENFDWPAVFYLFGGFGLAWTLWWESTMKDIGEKEPEVAKALERNATFFGLFSSSNSSSTTKSAMKINNSPTMVEQQQHDKTNNAIDNKLNGSNNNGLPQSIDNDSEESSSSSSSSLAAGAAHASHGGPIETNQDVPWRSFFTNKAVLALAYTHFCNNWFHYTMLAWLPTYFTETLSLDLTKAAQLSILPPVAAIIASAIAGPSADALITKGVPLGTVRKAAQCTAFLGPAACLSIAAQSPEGPLTVGLVTASLGLASFSLAGLYCNHADLSPKYAPVLLGLTNTAGALPGIAGVAATGWLYDVTGSWAAALFAPSIFFFLTGSAVYTAFGSAEKQDFS